MIKCPVCGAELGAGTPFCPICGAALTSSMRPFIAALIHLALCFLALYFIPKPYSYFAGLPFAAIALLALAAARRRRARFSSRSFPLKR